MVGTFFKA
jgi:hypothetical protein